MKTIVLILAVALSSCALLQETGEKAAKNAADAIREYCKLPRETREQFRGMVNENAKPHSAAIACAGDA